MKTYQLFLIKKSLLNTYLAVFLFLISGVLLHAKNNHLDSTIKHNKALKLNGISFSSTTNLVFTSIESKPHTGAVNLPIGSNITGLQKWSSNASWVGDLKPTNGDDVFIPENSVLVLDENISVKSITVAGKLIVDLSKDIRISTEFIFVKGAQAYFEWGTETEPYLKNGLITLIGTDTEKKIPNTNVTTKSIVVMNHGVLELHGEKKLSWTKLSANAIKNRDVISLVDPATNWKVGDSIIILSSRINMNQAEVKTIKSISNNGKIIRLNSVLNFPHIGTAHSYTSPSNKTWNADIRAEVGLLTKSIKIQGDADSEALNYGGHMMIHNNGVAHVEDVELYKMGQKKQLGRYPFHWHLVEERGAGQYLKNTSIYRSYNRAITIHGTESTLVEGNFCVDHMGHGLFMEDGGERFNIIRNNVVAVTRKPAKGDELTPSDNQFSTPQNASPSSYWITNPNNIVTNNVAGGSDGTGFWFIFPDKPIQQSSGVDRLKNLNPRGDKLGAFSGNTAHSNKNGFDIFDILRKDHSIGANASWNRSEKRYLDNNTWYANEIGVYGGIGGGVPTRNVIFRNNVFIDNEIHLMHANYSDHLNCIFVAKSGESVFNGERVLMKAYDGAFSITDSYLVGWNQPETKYASSIGGSKKHPNYVVSGIEKDFTGPPIFNLPNYNRLQKGPAGANSAAQVRVWIFAIWDKDGSLTGVPGGGTIISNHNMLRDGTEKPFENWRNTYFTKKRIGHLNFPITSGNENATNVPRMTFTRTKPGTSKAGHYHSNGFYNIPQTAVILNDDFLYTIQFENLPDNRKLTLRLEDTYKDGDHVIIRMKNFAKLAGITTEENYPVATTLTALKNSSETTVAKLGNHYYVKFFGTKLGVSVINFKWNIQPAGWPVLDTDNDGVTDRDETFAGTEYIGLGPLFENNPVLNVENVITNNNTLTLYPNPIASRQIVHLNGLENYSNLEVVVYDITGKVINSQKKGNTLNLKNAKSGMYFIKFFLKDKNTFITKKLVVK
ncbi:G8 domain-containing protein [Algibacter lectus]|uniref:G8 domain-containing protein n=1 Tax=Algibacter lectus TaxID=221126 RepID=UPI0024951225|nr:G8 domain-containing protein [Algibacter lectus]